MARPANSKPKTRNPKLLVELLISWFAANARDLPWRRTRDPYAIWVSEIMLQQTQVKTVMPYWERWMRELPTIASLAKASPEKIHKLWEGLGYYTRVRNMQKAAQEIISKSSSRREEAQTQADAISTAHDKHKSQRVISPPSPPRSGGEGRGEVVLGEQGREASASFPKSSFSNHPNPETPHVVSYEFPKTFDEVLALPGIGRYTAGAICSIAFNQPTPILDGNVIRVLTRIYGISENPREKKTNAELWTLAQELVTEAAIANRQPPIGNQKSFACSHLNQSLMELGALICTPRDPKCLLCPVSKHCFAFQNQRVNDFPNLDKRPTATARRFAAFVVESRGNFLVRQRPAGVVNAHLWEFPNIELNGSPATPAATAQALLGFAPKELKALCTIKHTITRYRITVDAFRVTVGQSCMPSARTSAPSSRHARPARDESEWLPLSELHKLSFPSAHKKILKCLGG